MKYSKNEIYSRVRKIPEIRFEDQRLTSFAGLVIFQSLFYDLRLKERLWRCFTHLKVEGSADLWPSCDCFVAHRPFVDGIPAASRD